MKRSDDFLVEIHVEELPPKVLAKLAESFWLQTKERLQKTGLAFDDMIYFATPRRLALLIKKLSSEQPEQLIERKGPALAAAFDAQGQPTPACAGFARSLGITPAQLTTIKTDQGEWVGYQQKVAGKSVNELLPPILEQAALSLPIPKRMRWGESKTEFVRPVHSVIMLYGDQIVPATLLGCEAGRVTRGHRFLAPDWMTIPHADTYATLLETEGFVIANFAKRREKVRELALAAAEKSLGADSNVLIEKDLLDEVTGLVEWPQALCGEFDADFLALPKEVLISSMQDHQRYFPVTNKKGEMHPHFITIINTDTHDTSRIKQGNERVIRARLSDAAFFYETDKKGKLETHLDKLKQIVYQAKLGSLFDKAERLSKLGGFIANKMQLNPELVLLAGVSGVIAKADLTSNMVGEFPELQGVMGYYYALQDGFANEIAVAIKEQYMPRFAGDDLPQSPVGIALAIADRIDLLVGSFGINQIPTGDKDPYGLRRAALGVLRILIENQINLDLKDVLDFAKSCYSNLLTNADTVPQLLNFFQERLRAWYQEQGIAADVFAAVAALGITNPLDVSARIKAVQTFKALSAAETLSAANKRVSNILTKYAEQIEADAINPAYFENPAEQELAKQLDMKDSIVSQLTKSHQYSEVLLQLAELKQPVDNFFDHVMVMTENKAQRENRILLLKRLRALFLQVADVALLQ